MKTFGIVCVLSLAAIPLLLGGCGSGGGGGGGVLPTPAPAPITLFSSVNHVVGIQGYVAPVPDEVSSAWGSATADGAGFVTAALSTVTNATLDSFGLTYVYDVDASRQFTWQFLAGTDTYRGGIAADGRVGALGAIQPLGLPGIFMTLRRQGTFGVTSLNGDYHVCAWEGGATPHVAYWGTANFDGAGTLSFTLNLNTEGVTGAPPLVGVLQPYSVRSNGEVSMAFGGGYDLFGGMLEGGDLVICGGSIGGLVPRIFVLIRQSTTATAATLSGNYFIVGIERNLGGPGYRSRTGTMTADPIAGTIAVTVQENADGVITTSTPPPLPYTVAASGLLTVTETGFPTDLVGGVSPGGEFATIAGGLAGGSDPNLFFMVR